MGGKPRNGRDTARRSPKFAWAPPPAVKAKPEKLGYHGRCGKEAVYAGMSRLVPGSDIYLVAFRCKGCDEEFSQKMGWKDARRIRIRAYALEGTLLCDRCGDPLLNKKGEPHVHDDVKKEGAEA